MDNPSATPDISIQISEAPVPILRHPRWMQISYPENLAENDLIAKLKNYLETTEELAKTTNVKQLKIQTDPSWEGLSGIGFTKAVYYIDIENQALEDLDPGDKTIEPSETTEPLTQLIQEHFAFHHKSNPEYYTDNIVERAGTFSAYADKIIADKKGFLLTALLDTVPVGFLYGEHEGGQGTIDEMFVAERYRDTGFGTAMLRASASKFKLAGCERVDAYVCVDIPAVEFYNSRGFNKDSVFWIRNIE